MNNATSLAALIDRATKCAAANTGAAMHSSALVCLDDARELAADGDSISAARRALKAIAYSAGIFHADYRSALASYDAWYLSAKGGSR